MVLCIAVLASLWVTTLMLYLDMRWQFKRYRTFIFEELFKGEDSHRIPTEPLYVRRPLEKPHRRVKHVADRSRPS